MPPPRLTLTAITGIPLVQPGDDLASIIYGAAQQNDLILHPGDVLVIAQKIVSKAEGRFVDLREITPSPCALELSSKTEKDPRLVELILSESTEVVRYKLGVLLVAHRLGYVLANAGIDHSNVSPLGEGEYVLLLPTDSDRTCAELRQNLRLLSGVDVGIVISDSHGRAWRNGTVGVAVGVAGVNALLDKRGTSDLFGNHLEVTQIGVADEIAAAASILMGQAAEGLPVVHIRGLPYELGEGDAQELIRSKEEDLFR